MSRDDSPEPEPDLAGDVNPSVSAWIFFGLLVLLAGGFLAYSLLKARPSPPPPDIAGDALLVEGREVYLSRCVSCHGREGKGDGPIAHGLAGPPPGNLTDGQWKHGDHPDQVLKVVTVGVKDTAMPGFAGTFTAQEIRAVTAYVYHLAGRPVPASLRKP